MLLNHKQLTTLLLLVVFTKSGFAADIENGKSLHDGNCINCHAKLLGGDGTAIYTREDRKMETYGALSKQVRRCRDSLGMPWPEEQIIDVITYLNQSFYHFKEE